MRKPYANHTHKTHTRNAETHTTGSQKRNEHTPKKYTSIHKVHEKVVEIMQTWYANRTQITHNTRKPNVEQHTTSSLKW